MMAQRPHLGNAWNERPKRTLAAPCHPSVGITPRSWYSRSSIGSPLNLLSDELPSSTPPGWPQAQRRGLEPKSHALPVQQRS